MFWVFYVRNFVCTKKVHQSKKSTHSNTADVVRQTEKNKNYTGHMEKHRV
jgi:hypothetical protein